MNKQKLISVLQSRITKRKAVITFFWKEYEKYERLCTIDKDTAQELGYEQKVDKQLLRQLIVDERELKELREIRNLMYCEY
jgi:hypothetical protein